MSIFIIFKGSVGYSAHWDPQGVLGWVQLHGYVGDEHSHDLLGFGRVFCPLESPGCFRVGTAL